MKDIPELPEEKLTKEQTKRKQQLLKHPVKQMSIEDNGDLTKLIDNFSKASFQARKIGEAAKLYYSEIKSGKTIIWSLAGSIFSAGLRQMVIDSINSNLVDALVCTGALFEQDMLEALGHKHYICDPKQDDSELQELHIDVFNGLKNLKYLVLSNNKLGKLKQTVFDGLYNLIYLDLQNTNLQELSQDVFNELKNLEELYLDSNKLQKLPQNVFNELTNLK